MDFREVLNKFDIKENVLSVKNFGSGHINETYLVSCDTTSYILQSLNTQVFKDFAGVMDNIAKVTSFIKKKAEFEGKDLNKCLYLIKTTDGENYFYYNN